jgi:hypothetical protein
VLAGTATVQVRGLEQRAYTAVILEAQVKRPIASGSEPLMMAPQSGISMHTPPGPQPNEQFHCHVPTAIESTSARKRACVASRECTTGRGSTWGVQRADTERLPLRINVAKAVRVEVRLAVTIVHVAPLRGAPVAEAAAAVCKPHRRGSRLACSLRVDPR